MDTDVVVVGAGLAGLRCARRLVELGHAVVVLEREDAVGGRVRADVIDGFRCDRGFQVLNPAYPAMRQWVDVDSLRLGQFGAGVQVRRVDGLAVLADPLREPRLLARTLRSGYARPGELIALARWAAVVMVRPQSVAHEKDRSLTDSLDEAGVTGRLRREVLDPFLAGVLVDRDGDVSARFAKLLVRSFMLGRPGVPAAGMVALPEQLAAPLGDRLRLRAAVVGITASGHRVDVRVDGAGGETIRARAAVVAADPVAAAELSGILRPETPGLVTWWFEAPDPPTALPLIAVDGRRHGPGTPGPVWNTALLTAAAPSYAPPGRHLVEATCLLDRPDGGAGEDSGAAEAEVLRHAGKIHGCDTSGWRLITRHHVPAALPVLRPGVGMRRSVDLGDGVFVCGDHRDTPSLQGALVSGNRTAAAVHARLAGSGTG